jgi:N-acetylglucosamine-6-phosphate deacetylase
VAAVALVNGRILLDGAFETDRAVLVDAGRILDVVAQDSVTEEGDRYDLGGMMLVPGFIDTQVNGGGGVLFNDDPSVEAIARIGAAHRTFGTTGFLPTLISDDLDKVRLAMDAVDRAIEAGVPGVLGIHIEGPFLSLGRRGIHRADKIRSIDADAVALLGRGGRGRTMVTLAPEKVSVDAIRQLSDAGVIVSAGHTDATAAQTFAALDAGLRGFTHLFNAMSQMTSREPGVVGAALYDRRAWCGIIVDGRHVDPVTLQVAMRSRGCERIMLVTDAMPTVGASDKAFDLQGRAISVENGVCVDEAGTLAGSDLDMETAVRNSVGMLGLGVPAAVAMASASPAGFLGMGDERGRIAPGYCADMVLLDDALRVRQSWIAGKATPSAERP